MADAAGRLPARTDGMHRVRSQLERQSRLFSRAGGWADVPRRQAAGVVRDFKRIACSRSANVSCSGGKFCGEAVAKSAGGRLAEISDSNLTAAYREKTGDSWNAGEGRVLAVAALATNPGASLNLSSGRG